MSLSMETPKAKTTCWAIRGQPHEGLRCFVLTMASMSSLDGPFGPGFRPRFGEKRMRYFRFLRVWWKFNRIEGFSTIAERITRVGCMNRVHNPATKRSDARRLGALCRERFRIRSCCLTRTDSATTARLPPGPKSRESVTMTWTRRMTRSRISALQQERETQRIGATISNSPGTGAGGSVHEAVFQSTLVGFNR